jgi:hypothetical protein
MRYMGQQMMVKCSFYTVREQKSKLTSLLSYFPPRFTKDAINVKYTIAKYATLAVELHFHLLWTLAKV